MGARRSQKRSVKYEKDQAGCMWGLITMFDFRHGRIAHKLIADKRHGSKHISGSSISKNKFEVLSHLEENYQAIIDGDESVILTPTDGGDKPSVKKLIEEEMVNEQESRDTVMEKRSEAKRKKKGRKKSHDMDSSNLNVVENGDNLQQESAKDLVVDEIMEEFSRRIHQKGDIVTRDGFNGEASKLTKERHSDLEEKLREAIKEFIFQKFTNEKSLKDDQKIQNSKELIDELELISSDEDLFMKLVQDPQSLLVKFNQKLQEFNPEKDEGSKAVGGKFEDIINHKNRSFFRRKSKSQERNQAKETENSDSLDRIVILKPGPVLGLRQPCNTVATKESSQKFGSHFFLAEIKKRLKNAMGKQQHEIPNKGHNEKLARKVSLGRNSPTKDHFFIEKITKPSTNSKMKEPQIQMSDVFPNGRISNIYLEAKKHLSELLSNGENGEFSGLQDPKTLGRILSLPEYNASPSGSPGRELETSFVSARTRFSSQDKSQNLDENTSREAQNVDDETVAANSNSDISGEIVPEIKPVSDDTGCEDDLGNVKEEIAIEDVPSEPNGSSTGNDLDTNALIVPDEKSDSACLEQKLVEENQFQSSPPESPCSFTKSRVSDLEIPIELPERPSPISVLEAVFEEDDIAPPNTISQSVKIIIQPLRISFEEPDSPPTDEAFHGKGFTNNKDLIFGYVKALMATSGLSWDEICLRLLHSDQLLNEALLDDVPFFPSQLCLDRKLLFDCVNEVLVEVSRYYFGSSPWVSFTKPSVCVIPDAKSVNLEVSKGVYWHFLQPPLPKTLDQIVKKDMDRSRTWLDARFDAETIGFDVGEAILDDLMDETVWGHEEDSVDEYCLC